MKDGLLEVGDELYTHDRLNNKTMIYAGKIDRVTKTLAFVGAKRLHRKYNRGTESPGDFSRYSTTFYYLLDDKAKAELAEQKIRMALRKPLRVMIANGSPSQLESLSNDQLERINAILAEVKL